MTDDFAAIFRAERPGWDPPFTLPEGVQVRRDVTFGTGGGRELRADLFVPPERGGDPRPAMLFIHGGGWRAGTRSQFYRQAALLAAKGIVGVCCEYRLSGEGKYPAAVEDVKCAVRWMRATAQELNLDPNRIGVAGGSAGGHLAAMVVTTPGIEELEGVGGHPDQRSDVQLGVLLNPVTDMVFFVASEPLHPAVAEFMGGTLDEMPQAYHQASPAEFVGPQTPPCLLAHGTGDTTVPHEQSVRCADSRKQAGRQAELILVEGQPHGFFNSGPHFEVIHATMERFILEHFGLRA